MINEWDKLGWNLKVQSAKHRIGNLVYNKYNVTPSRKDREAWETVKGEMRRLYQLLGEEND